MKFLDKMRYAAAYMMSSSDNVIQNDANNTCSDVIN